jgi:drug/metabolite transporter (DMT)-like permease
VRDHQRSPVRGYLLALLAAACWASGGLTAKWLFTEPSAQTASWPLPPLGISIDPTALSGGRALLAFFLLVTYLAFRDRGALVVARRDLLFLAPFGVIGLAGVHFTYFMTISLTNVATAILLEYLAPVLVLIVSVAFLGQRFTWTLPAGVGLSIAGCAMVVGAIGGQGLVVTPAGVMWGLLSAVFFAGYSLMGSVASTRFKPFTTLVYGLGFATLFWMIALGPAPIIALFTDARSAGAVLFMSIVGTVVPFGAFLTALKDIPPTNATVTSTVEPVIAGIGAFLLFGEALTASQMMGGALVIAAIAMVQLPQKDPRPILPPQE